MTTITDPGSPRVQAIFLKLHLRMQLKGFAHSRLSRRDILARCSNITSGEYKNSKAGLASALADIEEFLNASA